MVAIFRSPFARSPEIQTLPSKEKRATRCEDRLARCCKPPLDLGAAEAPDGATVVPRGCGLFGRVWSLPLPAPLNPLRPCCQKLVEVCGISIYGKYAS